MVVTTSSGSTQEDTSRSQSEDQSAAAATRTENTSQRSKEDLEKLDSVQIPRASLERPEDHAGRNDESSKVDLKQHAIRQKLHEISEEQTNIPSAPNLDVQALNRVYNEKVNFLQGDIRELRQQAELLQRSGDRSWMKLEGTANITEQRLLSLLDNLSLEDLDSSLEPFSTTIDELIKETHAAFPKTTEPEEHGSPSSLELSLKENISTILNELGIELPETDLETAQLLLRQNREVFSDQSSVLQDKVQKQREELQHQLENLSDQTRSHEYGFLDTFTGRYDIENKADLMQIKHIGAQMQKLQALEAHLGAQQSQLSSIDGALTVLQAYFATNRGEDILAARHLASLQEGSTAGLVSAQMRGNLPVLNEVLSTAMVELREKNALSPEELNLYGEADSFDRLSSAVDISNDIDPETLTAVDIRDQLQRRQTFTTSNDVGGDAKDLFAVIPQLNGKNHPELMDLKYKRLTFHGSDHDGEAYTLLFTREASNTWNSLPKDAEPILLKPVHHLQYSTEKKPRSMTKVHLKEDPQLSTVNESDIGYLRNGQVFNAKGEQISLAEHPNSAWIQRQTELARSFSTMNYRPPAEIRVIDSGSFNRVPNRDPLYSIQTQSGETIRGVRMSEEVRQILKEKPPDGMTLVMTRIPSEISLGGRQQERVPGHSRTAKYNTWYGTQSPIDELRLEDLAYARDKNGTLEIRSVEETRASLASSASVRIGSSVTFPVSDRLPGTISYDGRTQNYLSTQSMRRIVFHGGEQEGREYNLVFNTQADQAWTSLPKDAQAVILRPVQSPSFSIRRSGGRNSQTFTTLTNAPHDFVLQPEDIGYYRDGKLFTHENQEIKIAGNTNEKWIRGQIDHGRGVGAVSLRYETPLISADGQNKLTEPLYRLHTNRGDRIEGVRLDPEVRELLKQEQPPGTSIVLKRIPEALQLGNRFERNGETLRQVLREPDTITLKDIALATRDSSGFSLANVTTINARETNLSADELQHVERDRVDKVLRALDKDGDITHMQSASLSMNQTLSHLQSSLEAHGVGSSREAFVDFVRSEAKPMHEFLNSPETAERVARLEVKLLQLKELERGVADGKTEQLVHQQIQAIEQYVKIVKDPKIRNVVETLMDTSKFGPDNWEHWSTHELPIIAGAVAGAVAGSALIVFTAGAAGVLVVPLWVGAAGGAIGGLIGAELTREGLYLYHNTIGDAADGNAIYQDRSLFGTKVTGTAIFNPESGQYEQVTWGQVTGDYSAQLATNFALSYATMLGSKAMAGQVTKLFERTLVLEKIAARSETAKMALRYLANAQSRTLTELEKRQLPIALKEALKGLPTGFLDEMKDEALEAAGEEFLTRLSKNLGLTETGLEGSFAALALGTIGGTKVGPRSISYDARSTNVQDVQKIISDARSQGYVVQDIGRGYYTMLNPSTASKVTLRPMTEAEISSQNEANTADAPDHNTDQNPDQDRAQDSEQNYQGPPEQAPVQPNSDTLERFELRRQFYQNRVESLRRNHPQDWQQRVETDLQHERTILLEQAQTHLTAQGVALEPVRNEQGDLVALRISPVRGTSELNTYALRAQRSRGLSLEYDPAMIATETAGALYDAEEKRILLPHEVVRDGHKSLQVYHEKIHAVFDRIRDQGGNSLYFGSAELESGTLSLDEYATYSELLAREASALATVNLTEAQKQAAIGRIQEHLAVFAGFNSEINQVLLGLNPENLTASTELNHEIRVDHEGNRRVFLVANISAGDQTLSLDIASAENARGLPSAENAQQIAASKIAKLQEVAGVVANSLPEINQQLNADLLSPSDILRQSQILRAAVAQHYLLARATPLENSTTQLVLPPVPGRAEARPRLAATHESDVGNSTAFNLDAVLEATALSLEQSRVATPPESSKPTGENGPTAKPLQRHMRVQDALDPFEVQIDGEKITLRFDDGSNVQTNATLSSRGVDELFTQLKQQANSFGPRISNNLEMLKTAVELSKVQSALYGNNQIPQEAATALKAFLRRHQFPFSDISIREGSTSQERIASYQQFADTATRLVDTLQPRFKGEEINEIAASQIRDGLEREYGARALEDIISASSSPENLTLDDLIVQLEASGVRRLRPVTIEIKGEYLYDHEGRNTTYKFSIERAANWTLRIEQLSPQVLGNTSIQSFSQFLDRLETSTRLPGQTHGIWRNHARVSENNFDSSANSNSRSSATRYRATHEGTEGDSDDLLDRTIHYLDDPVGFGEPEQVRLYWDLVARGETSLVEDISGLENSARRDSQDWLYLEPDADLEDRPQIAERARHFGQFAGLSHEQQNRLNTAEETMGLANRFKGDPSALISSELLELHAAMLNEKSKSALDYADLVARADIARNELLTKLENKLELTLAERGALDTSLEVLGEFDSISESSRQILDDTAEIFRLQNIVRRGVSLIPEEFTHLQQLLADVSASDPLRIDQASISGHPQADLLAMLVTTTETTTENLSKIDFGNVLNQLNELSTFSDSEIRDLAEFLLLQESDVAKAESRIPENHPQHHEIQREIALQRVVEQLGIIEHQFAHGDLLSIVEDAAARNNISVEKATEILYHLTRYTELGGKRADSHTIAHQRAGDQPKMFYDVPVEGILSLQTALGEAGLLKFGVGNKDLMLYTPEIGSVSDQLAYITTRRNLGGTGISPGKMTHPLDGNTTSDITKATVVIVDNVIMDRLRSDKAFLEAVVASKAKLVLSPEIIGGLPMGSLNIESAHASLSERLDVSIQRYQIAEGETNATEINPDVLQSVMLDDVQAELTQLLNSVTEPNSQKFPKIITLDLNTQTIPNLQSVRSQLNGRKSEFNRDELIEVLQNALSKLDITLSPQEETLFLRAISESALILDTRRITQLMQNMHQEIIGKAEKIISEIHPDGKLQPEVFYVIPGDAKSYQEVAALYRTANNLDNSRFIRPEDVTKIRRQLKSENKFLIPVVLDDFAASGNSLLKVSLSAADGIPLMSSVNVDDVKKYAELRRERQPFPADRELVRRLFGPERSQPGQFPDPTRVNERPVIIAAVVATESGEATFLRNPISNHSEFVLGTQATSIQDTESWQQLLELESMTRGRMMQLTTAINMNRGVYDSTGRVTLVQFPHADSNTNARWWQSFVEPYTMLSPQAIHDYSHFFGGGNR